GSESWKKSMRYYADRIPYNNIAGYIRETMQNQTVKHDTDAETFFNTITNLSSGDIRMGFSYTFPNLYDELKTYLQSCGLSKETLRCLNEVLPDNRPHYKNLSEFIDRNKSMKNTKHVEKVLNTLSIFPSGVRKTFRYVSPE